MDNAFMKMGLSSNWGFLSSKEGKILCSFCEEYAIPFYKYLFSLIGFKLPFNKFDVNFLNHREISHSQLHLVS